MRHITHNESRRTFEWVQMWYDAFISSFMWRIHSFKCATRFIHMCNTTHACVRHAPSYLVQVVESVRHDSFMCVTRRIYMRGVTHLCLCHDSFMWSAVWCSALQCVAVGMTDFTQNATPEVQQIEKPMHMETDAYRNIDSSVSRGTNSNWNFTFIGSVLRNLSFWIWWISGV